MSFQFVTESQGVGSGFFFGLNLTFSILVFTHKGGGGGSEIPEIATSNFH